MNLARETEKAAAGRTPLFGAIRYNSGWDYDLDDEKAIQVSFDGTSQWGKFLEELSAIDYNAGYGSCQVRGYVVFSDGSWLARCSYDGSEWWTRFAIPQPGDDPFSSGVHCG